MSSRPLFPSLQGRKVLLLCPGNESNDAIMVSWPQKGKEEGGEGGEGGGVQLHVLVCAIILSE